MEVKQSAFLTDKERYQILSVSVSGCIFGGTIGDALGYPVEFMRYKDILAEYGENGITKFDLRRSGKAEISDDTQMTLYTANGLLFGETRGHLRGIAASSHSGAAKHHIFSLSSTQCCSSVRFTEPQKVGISPSP